MKKLLFLLCFIATTIVSFGQQSGVRYEIVPEGGGPYVLVNSEIQTLTYAATKTVTTTHEETTVQFASLTGAMTVNAVVTNCYKGDKLYCQFATDATTRTVTFGTNFVTSGTLIIPPSSYVESMFLFNGLKWVELSRQPSASSSATNFTATTYTATRTYTVTASELSGGLLVAATATATTTMVLPTTALLAAQVGAVAGTSIEFELINNGASNGTVTVSVSTGMTASGFPGTNTLTLAGSATVGIARFRIMFISATASTLTRIS